VIQGYVITAVRKSTVLSPQNIGEFPPFSLMLLTGPPSPGSSPKLRWLEVFHILNQQIERCELCPRLRQHSTNIAVVRRRAYRDQEYWGRPVPGFGDPRARILLLGLAPGAHGSNRTGRMFTGDRSG